MNAAGSRRIIIIGGGASGVLAAAHLLRSRDAAVRVTLVAGRGLLGRGIAYSPPSDGLLLNTRAANMSAFSDEPEHFWSWLVSKGEVDPSGDRFCFVPRSVYGRYLADLVQGSLAGDPHRLDIVQGECVALRELDRGVTATLADGRTVFGRAAIIATGHGMSATERNAADLASHPYASGWLPPDTAGIEPDDPILLNGTGLTMADYFLALKEAGHRGPVMAISRRGLLPQAHRDTTPLKLDAADIPFGTDMGYLFCWFRTQVTWATERGEDWRSMIDALRPFTQDIWRSLPVSGRRRFIEHVRPWWDVHRHRLPPSVEANLRAAIAWGQLRVVAGRIIRVEEAQPHARVIYRRRGEVEESTFPAARIVDCTGFVTNAPHETDPLLRQVTQDGLGQMDSLGLGLAVDEDLALIGRDGRHSRRLFAVGPPTKGAFWEVVAIADIREQCARLARLVTQTANAA